MFPIRGKGVCRTARTARTVALCIGLASLLPSPFAHVRQASPAAAPLPAPPGQPEVAALLARGCADCHSSLTRWPWYSRFAPGSWLVERDVAEARKYLNFSQWPEYGIEGQRLLLAAAGDQVQRAAMPPLRYTALHPSARLSPAERDLLVAWFREESQRLTAQAANP